MKFEHNMLVWLFAFVNTPERTEEHSKIETAEEAAKLPGNCVKSKEYNENSFPLHHGILVQYGNICIVRGHNSPVSPPFVWTGTKDEYHQFWEVD